MAKPGGPLKGIDVKGGKYASGSMIDLTVNENGEIQFEVLEAGDYKFIIQTSGNTLQNPTNGKKVIEKSLIGSERYFKNKCVMNLHRKNTNV